MMCSVSELPPVLQWDCIESGLLKVPLNLQALAWKHTVAEPKKAARLALKKLQKNVSKKAKVLGASWKKHLQDKLKGPSLSQAVAAVVPVAGGGVESLLRERILSRFLCRASLGSVAPSDSF